jgi:ferredoxin--NADP+ reductase
MRNLSSGLSAVSILGNVMINGSSGILSFQRNFTFKAGQVIGITAKPENIPRLYSIASAENDQNIEILYKVVSRGELTPILSQLKPGKTIFISAPFGNFINNLQNAFYIAAGTGIAPFISMIKSGYCKNITLLHGSRKKEEFYYSGYLSGLLSDKYIQCYTGNEDIAAFKGRVTEYLNEIAILDQNIKYYLCGSAEMVVDSRETLIQRGIPFYNISSEIYF